MLVCRLGGWSAVHLSHLAELLLGLVRLDGHGEPGHVGARVVHVDDLKLLPLALELLVQVFEELGESPALRVPGCGEEDADILAVELVDAHLGHVPLKERIAEHLLDVGVALLEPGELLGKGLAVRVLNDVGHGGGDVAVDSLAFLVEEDEHGDLADLEAARELLVGGPAVDGDGKPGHGAHELLESLLTLGSPPGNGRGHIDNLKRLALLLSQLLVDLRRYNGLFQGSGPPAGFLKERGRELQVQRNKAEIHALPRTASPQPPSLAIALPSQIDTPSPVSHLDEGSEELLAGARPSGAKEDGNMLLALEAGLGSDLPSPLPVEGRSKERLIAARVRGGVLLASVFAVRTLLSRHHGRRAEARPFQTCKMRRENRPMHEGGQGSPSGARACGGNFDQDALELESQPTRGRSRSSKAGQACGAEQARQCGGVCVLMRGGCRPRICTALNKTLQFQCGDSFQHSAGFPRWQSFSTRSGRSGRCKMRRRGNRSDGARQSGSEGVTQGSLTTNSCDIFTVLDAVFPEPRVV